jgi:hypothetical protein
LTDMMWVGTPASSAARSVSRQPARSCTLAAVAVTSLRARPERR